MVRRISELEALRGLMALWVMLGHIYLTFPQEQFGLIGRALRNNGMAVDVFIILSGFVIFNLLDRERGGYRSYIVRRFFRIYPVYFVLLLVSLALLEIAGGAFADPFWQSQRNASRIRIIMDAKSNLEAHVAAHLALVHGLIPNRLLPSAEYTILGQAWSISLEWQFYLIAPLCFWAVLRSPLYGAVSVLLVVTAAHFGLRYFAGEGFLPAAAPYFVLGGTSYFLWKHQAALAGLSAAATAASIAVVVALSLMLCPLPVAIWTAVLGALLLHALHPAYIPAALVVRCLRNPALTWLGTISYSLYLVHMIPLIIALKVMPESFKRDGLYQPYLFGSVIVSSLLLSWFAYHLVERPGIAIGKLVAARWQRKPIASTEAA